MARRFDARSRSPSGPAAKVGSMHRGINVRTRFSRRTRVSLRLSPFVSLVLALQPALVPTTRAHASRTPAAQTPTEQTNAPDAQPITTLAKGDPAAREITGGQRHVYRIPVSEGQYLKVEVRPRGADVGVMLQSPGGEKTQPYVPFGNDRQVLVMGWVAETSGDVRLEVYAREKASGSYEIRLAELRAATDGDRALHQARKFFLDYARLMREARFAEARAPLERALEIREKVLGPDDMLVAETLGFLATTYMSTGDYASAEPLKLRALRIMEKALGPEHPRVAQELTGLGGFYREVGDEARAEEMYLKSLAIFEKTGQAESAVVASLLNGLGSIYYARADYPNAERYFERSRALWEKLLGPDSFHLADSYKHLGRVAYDAGDYAKAEAMFRHALALAEKGLGQEHTSVTPYLNDLADTYCTEGQYERGESLYGRALAVHERKAAMGQPAVQDTLFGLARCAEAQGRLSDAAKLQTRAGELEERYVALNLAAGSEREKLALLAELSSRLSRNVSLHVSLAPRDAAARDLAAASILRGKGRVQDAMSASLAALRRRSSPEDQKLLDRLNDADARLSKLIVGGPPQKATPAEYQEQVESLEGQREDLEVEIGERSAGYYQRAQPVTLAAVQASIPEGAALVEFAVYRPFDPKAPDNAKAYGEPRYAAYVLRRRGEAQWKELGEARAIDGAVAALRRALGDPQRRDARSLARALDEKLMRPLRAAAGDAAQLLVSPDGQLSLLPFQALVDEQGRYLVERYSFTYLTSGRDLLRMQVARESKSAPLVVANPAFGESAPEQKAGATAEERNARATKERTASGASKRMGQSARRGSVTDARTLSELYFAPLGGTAEEADAIQKLFPDARLLTGERATTGALKQAVAPRILHIATHGFFLQTPQALAEGNARTATTTATKTVRGAPASAASDNPLLRSGLALAGANRRGEAASDDGILTALEASGLNLWGTKLVVLSACDTGLGEVHNGEGVYGLRRAFVLAGAETLVMSLWPASDYSTRTLMTGYYRNLKQGAGRGAALRQVQLEMLRRDPKLHPFYWANFIQSGEWADLDGRR
jgi:CHAT domain-containing protein/Tfp pilus assembly protein PilF